MKNNNNPFRTITFSRNRRLRCECCLKVVLEHPGEPNRWRREPQEHPKGNQETPKRHRRATKSTRSEAKRAPKSTQKKPNRAIESSKAKMVIPIPDVGIGNRVPAEARARFSMPEKWRQGNLPRGGAVDPLCKEKLLRLGVRSDMSQNAQENSCDLAKSTFYSNLSLRSQRLISIPRLYFCLRGRLFPGKASARVLF